MLPEDLQGRFVLEFHERSNVTVDIVHVVIEGHGRPILLKTNNGVVYNWTHIVSMTPQER